VRVRVRVMVRVRVRVRFNLWRAIASVKKVRSHR
jgi:hypothetical protein